MDYSKFIVSNHKEEAISILMVNILMRIVKTRLVPVIFWLLLYG